MPTVQPVYTVRPLSVVRPACTVRPVDIDPDGAGIDPGGGGGPAAPDRAHRARRP
jgi:hypothetical protein